MRGCLKVLKLLPPAAKASKTASLKTTERGRRAVTLKLQEKDGMGREEMHRKRAMHSREVGANPSLTRYHFYGVKLHQRLVGFFLPLGRFVQSYLAFSKSLSLGHCYLSDH